MDSLTILIIRHAEKAGEAWPGPGLTPDGIEDKQSLVIRGWQRAGGWGALFATGLGGLDYPKPSVIYAADPNARAIDEPSQRPFQTIIPLATRLGLTPVTDFAVGAETELATSITAQAGVVLVAWEHKAITRSLLPAIAKDQALVNMPQNGTRHALTLCCDLIALLLKDLGPCASSSPACFLEIPRTPWPDNDEKLG
jgi:hypothetical protein